MLRPMAMGNGLLFASILTLVLLPCLYLINIEIQNSINDGLSIDNNIANSYLDWNFSRKIDTSNGLAKNKAGINTTLDTDLALINQKIGNLQVEINTNNFINNSLKKFWKMKFLEHKVNIANKSLANGKRQLNLINQRFKSNLVDKSDVLLQTNNYQNQNISLIEEVQRELQSINKELQNLTGIKIKNNDLKLEKL
ncbi:TolC family protein [Isorropodon fossajaponicum symbiont]|uniref:TolC family protein n=1 Tax=Isorropodon fossajaponicum symbiont TaxID=883811 RepID=UPI001CED5B9A|nr:TolC family protein [Isorropodon fossajaponicum symbiont]